jgi:hypothetical protein
VAPSVTTAPTQDLNSLGTAVMSTMIAGATQTAQGVIPVDVVESPLPTSTPELPTLTPTVTLTPTPIFTATPVVPQISVSVATNCRIGPGKIYDRVGALLVGQVSEVVGRNATNNYWYIRNPNRPEGFCWLWGEYATVTGNFAVLPVFTPPPTPTPMPAFEAEYDGLETCSGWWVDIELINVGGISFDSVALTVRDLDTNVVVTMNSDTFTNLNGCSDSSSRDTLDPGESPNISSTAFAYDPSGHELRATITLCSGEGLNGTCLTEVIEFEP